MSIDNYIALNEFADFNQVKRNAFGLCKFSADIIIKASGRGGAETLEVRINFASEDTDQVVITAEDVLKFGQLPLYDRAYFDKWTHANGVLTIAGRYKGIAYTTEVRPAS